MNPRQPFEVPLTEVRPEPDNLVEAAQKLGPAAVHEGASLSFQDGRNEREMPAITLDFADLTEMRINDLFAERVPATTIRPHLVLPDEVRVPEAYARLGDQEQKNHYRGALREGLLAAWQQEYGDEKGEQILERFNQLSSLAEEEGAVVFGDLIDRESFARLVEEYDELMRKDGSSSLLHSYANLRNQPDFLTNPAFNGAFFHPLAIALISERVGGAIRVVDARAKDAGPISARAQDNMLHIDNTPFRDEWKILVTWEMSKASGPKGQNFVFLPGTHKGVRDSLVGPDGKAFSTENASIFINPQDVDKVFALQQRVRAGGSAVVEIHDEERPLTTVFPSGSIVHHRLRTEGGHSRSSLIIAFHRGADTPGEFIGNYQQDDSHALEKALFGLQGADSDAEFHQMLAGYATKIAEKVEAVFAANDATILIDAQARTLAPDDMEEWYKIATGAPTVEQIKQRAAYFPLGETLSFEEFVELLGPKMMLHDKHGPIDMILYDDGHEEPRKWARNRIREMREDVLQQRLDEWKDQIRQPFITDLLTLDEIGEITARLVEIAASVPTEVRKQAHLDPIERISPQEAYRATEQLIIDLGENLTRSDDRQTYLSASLFQFWACDELNRLQGNNNPELRELGGQLLRNYIAAAVLIEKQIAQEN